MPKIKDILETYFYIITYFNVWIRGKTYRRLANRRHCLPKQPRDLDPRAFFLYQCSTAVCHCHVTLGGKIEQFTA